MKNFIFKKTILFLLLFIGISCGTKKKSLSEQRETSINVIETQLIEVDKSYITIDDISNIIERTTIRRIITFSEPDSTGHQYPLQTEEEEVKETIRSEQQTTTQETDSTRINNTVAIDQNEKTSLQADEKTDNRILPAWVWVIVAVFLCCLVVYGLLRMIHRKAIP